MYSFNQETKRLEPSETLCQYCETEHSTDMEDNYFIPMFQEVDRTNVIVYRNVKFKKIPVGIPRCKTCRGVHEYADLSSTLAGWGIGIGTVVLGFVAFGAIGFLALFLSIPIGFLSALGIEKYMIRKKQIYTPKEGAKQNELVQDLVLHGWSWTQPMA